MKSKALLLYFFCTFFSVSAEGIKIGYIDIDRVIESSQLYNESNSSLIEEFEPKQKELYDFLEHINLLKENFNKQIAQSEDSNYQKDIEKIQSLERELQIETNLWQQELNQKKLNLLQEIEQRINKAVNEYAISQKFDLILYQNGAYVSPKIDISEQIIQMIEY
jgi:outer membrane protein